MEERSSNKVVVKQEELVGKAQTVLGLVDPASLGITLAHEHLLCDTSVYFNEPADATEKAIANGPVTLETLSWVRRNPMFIRDNMLLTDEQLAVQEAHLFKQAGGETVVEMSNIGSARDPLGLVRISQTTGLNVVMGCGYYVGLSHPPELATQTEEEIAAGIVRDIIVGVGDTGVCAGIIGEIGCSSPIEENERKVLRASAIAQQQTGASINVHPPFSGDLTLDIVEILRDAGADLSRTIISHVDLFCFSLSTRRKLADAGCYIEHDTFGFLSGPYCEDGDWIDFPSDSQRIMDIKQLIDDGYLSRILIASDHCTKDSLTAYGGFGYAHILRNILPAMGAKGISDEQINTLLVDNPKRILQFVPPKSDR